MHQIIFVKTKKSHAAEIQVAFEKIQKLHKASPNLLVYCFDTNQNAFTITTSAGYTSMPFDTFKKSSTCCLMLSSMSEERELKKFAKLLKKAKVDIILDISCCKLSNNQPSTCDIAWFTLLLEDIPNVQKIVISSPTHKQLLSLLNYSSTPITYYNGIDNIPYNKRVDPQVLLLGKKSNNSLLLNFTSEKFYIGTDQETTQTTNQQQTILMTFSESLLSPQTSTWIQSIALLCHSVICLIYTEDEPTEIVKKLIKVSTEISTSSGINLTVITMREKELTSIELFEKFKPSVLISSDITAKDMFGLSELAIHAMSCNIFTAAVLPCFNETNDAASNLLPAGLFLGLNSVTDLSARTVNELVSKTKLRVYPGNCTNKYLSVDNNECNGLLLENHFSF